MRMKFAVTLALVAVLLGTATSAMATDLYVATTGSDSNPGTQAQPFATINQAASVATAGTTVHVAPGSYNANTTCTDEYGSLTSMVCVNTSGTASAPITFISDTQWGAKLSCQGDGMLFTVYNASYVNIEGFDITCPGTSGGGYGTAISLYANSGHITISGNNIHDISTSQCNSAGAVSTGDTTTSLSYTNAGYNVINGNIIRHVGLTSANSSSPYYCLTHHAIYDGAPHDVITNNIISGAATWGIQLAGNGTCYDTVSANTVFDNGVGGILAENGVHGLDFCNNGETTDYITITDNLIVNNGYTVNSSGAIVGPYYGAAINLYSPQSGGVPGSHNIVSNNMIFGNNTPCGNDEVCTADGQSSLASPVTQQNTITTGTTTAVFTNYQADKNWAPVSSYNFQNYNEVSGSPTIGAGMSTGAPSHDIVNTPRPGSQGYDIGAFQYVGPPSVPTNLNSNPVSSSQINLTWSPSTDKLGVTGYNVFRNGTQVGTSVTAGYNDTGLAASTVYTYAVSAYNAAENTSAQSSSLSAITRGAHFPPIAIGTDVTTTANLNVRQTASASAMLLGTEAVGAVGTVGGGPTTANGHVWWQVNYANGIVGWSIADYLAASAVPSSPHVGMLEPSPPAESAPIFRR
jgi:hypothetical protein